MSGFDTTKTGQVSTRENKKKHTGVDYKIKDRSIILQSLRNSTIEIFGHLIHKVHPYISIVTAELHPGKSTTVDSEFEIVDFDMVTWRYTGKLYPTL